VKEEPPNSDWWTGISVADVAKVVEVTDAFLKGNGAASAAENDAFTTAYCVRLLCSGVLLLADLNQFVMERTALEIASAGPSDQNTAKLQNWLGRVYTILTMLKKGADKLPPQWHEAIVDARESIFRWFDHLEQAVGNRLLKRYLDSLPPPQS